MKKNITINLSGRLFAIDEDAYEMLRTYEQSLRNFFRQREGGEEIADDLETRIAELFDELKAQGIEAINIDHVREVIHRIGTPEEMEGSALNEQPAPSSAAEEASAGRQQAGAGESATAGQKAATDRPGLSAKRLYRNPDDKKLMGVLSGFAAYFGGDVLWWRLGFAAAVLLSFAGSWYNFLWFMPHHFLYFQIYFWGIALIIAYILLAILMPVAETPEDRLRMKGKEVNPQNLAEEVASQAPMTPISSPVEDTYAKSSSYQTTEAPSEAVGRATPGHRGPAGCVASTFGCIGGFFAALWAVIVFIVRWCIYACGAFLAGMCLVGIVCLSAVALNPTDTILRDRGFMQSEEFAAIMPDLQLPFIIFVVAAAVVLAITAYAIIHSLLNEFRQMPSMPYRQRIALLVMWIVGLMVVGAAAGYGVPKFGQAQEDYNSRMYERYQEQNIHDGIFVQPHEWEWLQAGGWKILTAQGCNDRFTARGEYLTGDRDVRYLDCYDDNHRQRLRVERADTLQPGTYQLSCAARANGTGACVYLIVGNRRPQFLKIPATGNTGGSIWAEAKEILSRDKPILPGDEERIERQRSDPYAERYSANDAQGFGWNRLTYGPFRIDQTTIVRYGLSSDPAFTHHTWLGQWFSAADFEVSSVQAD